MADDLSERRSKSEHHRSAPASLRTSLLYLICQARGLNKMNRKAVFNDIGKGLIATLLIFVILETLLRIAYFARNSMVTEVPLPYVFGYDYGPIPPWLDGLRMLEADKALIWKNRPNIHRRYVDVFSPAHSEQERTAL